MTQFIAATVRSEKGRENALLAAANKVAVDPLELSEMEAAQASEADVPSVTANKPGSFEQFMGSFGSPRRWRG